ncbi:MAG: hypothetical protein WCK27_19500 [Verrucomicrobiota bacterium]
MKREGKAIRQAHGKVIGEPSFNAKTPRPGDLLPAKAGVPQTFVTPRLVTANKR